MDRINDKDAGLISSGSVAFTAGNDLTTEKKTDAIDLNIDTQVNDIYVLVIDKPTENTAGNLTVKIYNQVKVDGTNSRDVLHTTHTVEKITDLGTYRDFLIQGLFCGEGTIKISATFATDSGAITVYYKLFRL